MTNNFKVKGLVLAMGMTFASTPVFAADEDGADDDGQIMVVVGSRAAPRSVGDSPVPIDVISAADLMANGATDMSTLLRTMTPSYNVNDQGISDGATIVRPANLRGLSPDSTLILVNGKRRHKGSVIAFSGGGIADGAQSPDVSVIPGMALKQVEVLRDGASAQYGSDAIAGVINFVLKDNNSGGTFAVKAGQFSEGDGDLLTVSGNVGMELSERGFASFTFEFNQQDPTSRSTQRADAQGLIDAGNTNVRTPAAQVWGTPDVSDDFKLFLNTGIELSNTSEAYMFGNWSEKTVEGGFFFRNPHTRSGVFGGPGVLEDDGSTTPTLLTGDLTPGATDNSACPIVRINNNVPDQAALDSLAAAGCFSHYQNIPGGFTPSFGGNVVDLALAAGVRGEFDGGTTYDFSASVGEHSTEFFINNTLNSSLGPVSPRDFTPGAYAQLEQALNADFSKDFDNWVMSYGAEFRRTQFTITAGDPASYTVGALAVQGFGPASNGFPGFKPEDAGASSRNSKAVYFDAEYDITEDFLGQAAFRFEDFSDFGSTFNWKLAGLYTISDSFKVRASASTGFRAPTIGQANVRNVQTQADANGFLQDIATLPPTNPVSVSFGGKALTPEESESIAVGFVYESGDFFLTADYFNVEVTDRISQTSGIEIDDTARQALIDLGITDAIGLTSVKFFTNDFDTTTQGVDLVANYSSEAFGGDMSYSLAFAWTETTVDSAGDNVDARKIGRLEDGLPKTKGSFTTNYSADNWRLMGRINYYGEWKQFSPNIDGPVAWLLDTEFSYDVNESTAFAFGINNLTDENGPVAPINADGLSTSSGRSYSTTTPYGSNGRFYYASLTYTY
ncbi:MAG: TonB-dependent receptor [Gammaproteobacteria bacterium]|nr:MAG: TonB-dependent receptor [Gammaproteobacteria bacterium]